MAEPSEIGSVKQVRVMVDATVLFAGTIWPRWSFEILHHALRGDFRLLLSPLVIAGAKEALHAKFPAHVAAFDSWLQACPLEFVPDPDPQEVAANQTRVRHFADVPIALAAIHARADYFVTEDKDFTDENATTMQLRQRLHIMRPVIFLREVMGWSSENLKISRHRNWPSEEK
jgi:predicted nucleic acid-binding protein